MGRVAVLGGIGRAAALRARRRGVRSARRASSPGARSSVNMQRRRSLLGVIAGAGAARRRPAPRGHGLLGSYTTFSTWMLETHRLAEDGELARPPSLNVLVSLRWASAPPRSGGRIGAVRCERGLPQAHRLLRRARPRRRHSSSPTRLLDLFARHGCEASVLLRGAEGFGAKQRLQTDRLLSLSEDLPWWRWRSTRASGSRRRCPRSPR